MENNNIHNNKKNMVRRSKLEMMSCPKHPKHHQSPGVCSVCLRDKLSKLANHASSSRSSHAIANASSSELSSSSLSSLSSLSSSNASSGRSSPKQRQHHRKPVGMYLSSLLRPQRRSGSVVLTKSRSMVFAGEIQKEEIKKSGFWSKLIGSSSMRKRSSNPKRMDEEVGLNLMHSRTMRDMFTTI